MVAQIQNYTDYIDPHGIPIATPAQYNPGEIEESGNQPGYQPAPTCGQCEHFYQGKIGRAKGTPWGYCPLLDAERRHTDKPCRLYREDCPF